MSGRIQAKPCCASIHTFSTIPTIWRGCSQESTTFVANSASTAYNIPDGATGGKVKIGLILPQGFFNEFEGWPADRAWQRILALAQLAERLGFESLSTGEHVLARWGGTSPAFDCWTLGTALAASVPRVGIGFIVLNSTFRNPVVSAKAA